MKHFSTMMYVHILYALVMHTASMDIACNDGIDIFSQREQQNNEQLQTKRFK